MTIKSSATRRTILGATAGALLAAPLTRPARAALTLPRRVLGKPEAPLLCIEYASLTCPHCAHFHKDTLPRLREAYVDTGKVQLEFRDFPLNELALQAAQIAQSASEDRYFPMLSAMFGQQESWMNADDPIVALKQLAALGGMSGETVDAALANEELKKAIAAVRFEGEQKHDVQSTPSFVLKERTYRGDQGVDGFTKLFDELLG